MDIGEFLFEDKKLIKKIFKIAVVPIATAINAGIIALNAALPTPTELIAEAPILDTIIISEVETNV